MRNNCLEYKNTILLEAKRTLEQIDEYENSKDEKYLSNFLQISRCIDDILNIETYNNDLGFNAIINNINKIYECSKTLINAMGKGSFKDTENTIYFKFVRVLINHPDGINDKKYLENTIYKKYINPKINKIVYKGTYYNLDKDRFFSLPSLRKRLFDEKSEEEFGISIDLGFPRFVILVCPYDKLFDCITDVVNQLKTTYINSDKSVLKEASNED